MACLDASTSKEPQNPIFIHRNLSSGPIYRSSSTERSQISGHAQLVRQQRKEYPFVHKQQCHFRASPGQAKKAGLNSVRKATLTWRHTEVQDVKHDPHRNRSAGTIVEKSRPSGRGRKLSSQIEHEKIRISGNVPSVRALTILGQEFDPFAATPIPLKGLILRTLRFAFDRCSELAPVTFPKDHDQPFRIYNDTTWALTLREHFRNALTNRIRFAGSLAVHSMRISSYEGALDRQDALKHMLLSVSTLREAMVEDARPSAHLFNAIWSLYEAELYMKDRQNILMHFRAAKSILQRLDFEQLSFEVAETFLRGAFVEIGINFWDVEPPILPIWDPTNDQLDQICNDNDLLQLAEAEINGIDFSHTWPYKDELFDEARLHPLLRNVLLQHKMQQIASRQPSSSQGSSRSTIDPCAVRRMLVRQQLLSLRLNDSRAHVVRLVLHLLVCNMDDWTWFQPLLVRMSQRIGDEIQAIPADMWAEHGMVLVWALDVCCRFHDDSGLLTLQKEALQELCSTYGRRQQPTCAPAAADLVWEHTGCWETFVLAGWDLGKIGKSGRSLGISS